MGLFTSLFGSATSDAAQKARQDALNAFNAVKTPELTDLQVQLQKYVDAGTLTPEQAETQLLGSNAFNAIVTDPSYVGAQKQALQQLQAVATQGGMTAVDKAQLNDINNAQNQQNQSQNAATMQQAQQRGVGGSDLNAVNQLINEQGSADRAANSGVQVAANAQQRALQAMQAAGSTGNALESQAYGEQANKANAQNAIDLYNQQALNQTNLFNTQTANAAQAANLANKQAVSNANTETGNANTEYNAQQNQTLYNDQLQKAQGIAGVDQNTANAEQAAKNTETGADLGLTSGLLQGGATALGAAFGGPAGAAAASTATKGTTAPNSQFGTVYDPTQNEMGYSEGGEVTDPEHPDHMSAGGHVHCYSHGGEAYHHPECMAKGGFLGHLKKGALHRDLGVPQGEKIPSGKIEKATHSDNETLRKRAQFAENAKHWQHKAEGGEVAASSDTAHVPVEAPKKEEKKPERNFIERLGDLLGSHGQAAQDILNESDGGEIPAPDAPLPITWAPEEKVWELKDKDGNRVGTFAEYSAAADFAAKVKDKEQPVQKDFRGGGPVPGKAKVAGDSPKNDTVDAKLSPGEIVVPRSAANDEDEFKSFMAKFEPKKRKMADGGKVAPAEVKIPPEARALANLHHRISRIERGR